jgi:hypothetical protein
MKKLTHKELGLHFAIQFRLAMRARDMEAANHWAYEMAEFLGANTVDLLVKGKELHERHIAELIAEIGKEHERSKE